MLSHKREMLVVLLLLFHCLLSGTPLEWIERQWSCLSGVIGKDRQIEISEGLKREEQSTRRLSFQQARLCLLWGFWKTGFQRIMRKFWWCYRTSYKCRALGKGTMLPFGNTSGPQRTLRWWLIRCRRQVLANGCEMLGRLLSNMTNLVISLPSRYLYHIFTFKI